MFHAGEMIPDSELAPLADSILRSSLALPCGCRLWLGLVLRGAPVLLGGWAVVLSVRSALYAIEEGAPIGQDWVPSCGRALCVAVEHRPLTPP